MERIYNIDGSTPSSIHDMYTWMVIGVHESKLLEEKFNSSVRPTIVWQLALSHTNICRRLSPTNIHGTCVGTYIENIKLKLRVN